MLCTVCNHPLRQAIDRALLSRTATLAQLSQKHDLSQSTLHRHKQHLQKKNAADPEPFPGYPA
jgi:transposase-like protein